MYPNSIPSSVQTSVQGDPSMTPAGFVQLVEPMQPWLDRKLGYAGNAPWVMFYYDRRCEGVIWRDDQSYGFGYGGWMAFLDQIAPLAERYAANAGSDARPAVDAFVLDRHSRRAFFAPLQSAQQFVEDH